MFFPLNLCHWTQFWQQKYWKTKIVNFKNTDFCKLLKTVSCWKYLVDIKKILIPNLLIYIYLHCVRSSLWCATMLATLMKMNIHVFIFFAKCPPKWKKTIKKMILLPGRSSSFPRDVLLADILLQLLWYSNLLWWIVGCSQGHFLPFFLFFSFFYRQTKKKDNKKWKSRKILHPFVSNWKSQRP